MCGEQKACVQSVTVVLDEDVSRQVTLTREGEVLIGVNPAPVLPFRDGKFHTRVPKTSPQSPQPTQKHLDPIT